MYTIHFKRSYPYLSLGRVPPTADYFVLTKAMLYSPFTLSCVLPSGKRIRLDKSDTIDFPFTLDLNAVFAKIASVHLELSP